MLRLGLLRPNLAPAACRHALTGENRTGRRRVGCLTLVLSTGAAFLTRFERWISFAVDFAGIVGESEGLGRRVARVQRRQGRCRGAAGYKTGYRQNCTGDEPALDD